MTGEMGKPYRESLENLMKVKYLRINFLKWYAMRYATNMQAMRNNLWILL